MSLNLGEIEQRLKAVEDHEQRLKALEDHIFERGLACREFDPVAFAIADRYGLSRLRAMMVRYMLTNKIATYGDLAEITENNGGRRNAEPGNSISVHISQIRAKIAPILLYNMKGAGYSMMDSDKKLMREQCGLSEP